MTDHEYDPDLPYVLVNTFTGDVMGRATSRPIAENFSAGLMIKIIDTTPKPRVPEDAEYITWLVNGSARWFAERRIGGWAVDGSTYGPLEHLPGVTADTEFTVLDAREGER